MSRLRKLIARWRCRRRGHVYREQTVVVVGQVAALPICNSCGKVDVRGIRTYRSQFPTPR